MSRTLRIFEHDTLHVSESGVSNAISSSEFDALVQFNDASGGRYFEVGHRKIRTKQFVGYVEVGKLGIEILPKADRKSAGGPQVWRDGLLEMLRVAMGMRLESPRSAAQELARHSFLDLIALRFVAEVELLQRHGLAKGYRRHRANGATFKGRLVVAEHLRENLVRADRFFVEFHTFDHDVLVNRVLSEALDELQRCSLSAVVGSRVAACRALFPACESNLPIDVFDRLRLTRSTARYESTLMLARMVLERTGPRLRAGRTRVFALLFDMNRLWERYVAVLFRRAAPQSMKVSAQENCAFWKPVARPRRRVRPDVVVRNSEAPHRGRLVVDTKWKVSRPLPSDDDLKQMFVYNELLGIERAVLVCPASNEKARFSGLFAGKLHSCEVFHLGLIDESGWSTANIQRQIASLLGVMTSGDAE
jgi:5-methylcytosine-specific restriction enzyme subunit McrC